MTEEDPYETPVEVKLPYRTWLKFVSMTHDGICYWEEEDTAVPEGYREAREAFMKKLKRPEGVEDPIKKHGLEDALRKAMSGRIPEFQEEIDDDTVYCEKCEIELDYTPSVLLVHNGRNHEEHL